jgi:hypothetical protein
MTVEHLTLNRYLLYDLVWSLGPSRAAAVAGLTRNALITACAKLSVPIPRAPMVRQLLAGKEVAREMLPSLDGPPELRFAYYRRGSSAADELHPAEAHKPDSTPRQSEAPPAPLQLEPNLHPLRKALLASLRKGVVDRRGWPTCGQTGLIELAVSEVNSHFGASLVEALFDLLVAAGYAPRSDLNGMSAAYVQVLGVSLQVDVLEKAAKLGRRSAQSNDLRNSGLAKRYAPTGRFQLVVHRKGEMKSLALLRAIDVRLLQNKLPWLVLRLPELARRASRFPNSSLITRNDIISAEIGEVWNPNGTSTIFASAAKRMRLHRLTQKTGSSPGS